MYFSLDKVALGCAIALSLTACNDNSSKAPADPVATKAALMQTMDDALRESQALDPYGFAIDAASIAKRKALDEALLKRLAALDPAVLSERDRLFYDMIRWDLQINLEGYGLPQSQIPIHHFRNRVVDLADEVGTAPASGRAARTVDGRFDYFTESSAERVAPGDASWRRDLDRTAAAPVQTRARAATAPLPWYQEHLTWLKAYDAYLAEVKHQFEQGSARGNTLPDELVDRLLAQLDGKLDGEAIAGSYLGWQQLPGEADEALRTDYKAVLDSINARYLALRDYLDYQHGGAYAVRLGNGECDDGFCGMTDGRDWYRWLLKKHTTTEMTPEAVHELGLTEVTRIFGAMVKVCHTVGKCDSDDVAQNKQSGQIYAFFRYLNEPGFFYQNPLATWSAGLNPDNAAGATLSEPQQQALAEHERALREYNAFKSKAAQVLPDFFDAEHTIPKLDYEVVPVAYEDAPYGGVAWYQDGNPQTGRKGQFFLNTYYPYGLQSWNISTLLAHEGAPGHHFQITIAQELAAKDPDFPQYVANASYTAYAEGWALYTEYLADHDMGLYQGRGLYDPAVGDVKVEGSPAFNNQLQYFGRLNEEMLRAMRLVVDTGIHWYGWSHDRAVGYMQENSALGAGDISSEVPRYMAYTGQATSYKAGQLALIRMRESAEQALGGGFDLKAFHHQVLEYGMLPISVLEQKNRQWIEASK
ncbi:DUF885 domain-containing protein [Aeromonas sanarellii]|uniref:DUF885 domain-containing protein n=1 Tax=Aeromonas sanarellii TaxID=633415 RepID=A0ABS4B7E3_9GAMM|nr:DUF885 domain-containing protein [Aeromonas sanarellii]MBP0603392.1 DUF885 domain-containing protein [Aeromonas sanarellii]